MNNSGPLATSHLSFKETANSLIGAALGQIANIGQRGANQGPTGTNHGKSGFNHGQTGMNNGQSGTNHGQSGTNHGQSGTNHGQSGTIPGQTGSANSPQRVCVGPSNNSPLSILKEVQKAYEERLQVIERVGGPKKLHMTVEVLRAWVDDLVGQNALLANIVEDLEAEATARLMLERTRHQETEGELRHELCALRRRLARKDSDLRGLIEVLRRLREFDYCTLDGIHFFEVTESDIFGAVSWRQKRLDEGDPDKRKAQGSNLKDAKVSTETLQKEIVSKEREIRRLHKDMQQYEQTIVNMRAEMSCSFRPEASKKDAEVMVGLCLKSELGGSEMAGFSSLLREEAARYQDKFRKMEVNLKSSSESVRALRKVNVALSEELHALRRVCAALDEQARAAGLRTQFKDDIIREMRRQLKQAKAKLKESNSDIKCTTDASGDNSKTSPRSEPRANTSICLRQPRRAGSSCYQRDAATNSCYQRDATPLHPDSDDCHTPRLDVSGDDRSRRNY